MNNVTTGVIQFVIQETMMMKNAIKNRSSWIHFKIQQLNPVENDFCVRDALISLYDGEKISRVHIVTIMQWKENEDKAIWSKAGKIFVISELVAVDSRIQMDVATSCTFHDPTTAFMASDGPAWGKGTNGWS